jgi:hypothetical protein
MADFALKHDDAHALPGARAFVRTFHERAAPPALDELLHLHQQVARVLIVLIGSVAGRAAAIGAMMVGAKYSQSRTAHSF